MTATRGGEAASVPSKCFLLKINNKTKQQEKKIEGIKEFNKLMILFSSELVIWKQLSFKGVKRVTNTTTVPIVGLVPLANVGAGFVSDYN